ncbi:MAG: alginate export family protein [Bacteroidales bacterium]|nr:alginate export family protein [Bacteroidales bacterium]
MKKLAIFLFLVMTSLSGFAQFEINAEIRPRGEFRHGYSLLPGPDSDPAYFVSQRTRLNLLYENEHFKIGIGIQDVRVWGDGQLHSSTGVFGDNASLDLNEGWIELKTGEKGALKLGRQYFSVEDERLLARRDWNQSSIKYDALLYKLNLKTWGFQIGLSYNNNKENIFGDDYNLYNDVIYFDTTTQTVITKKASLSSRIKSQNFLFIKKKFNENLHLSFIAMVTGVQNPLTTDIVYGKGTYGLYGQYIKNKIFMRGSVYYQNGKNFNGQKVNAYMFNYKADFNLKPWSFAAGIDYISGHDALKENAGYQKQDHFFDIFYGARHKYYGLMDYFNNMRVATSGGGLSDIYTGIGFAVSSNSKINLDYHFFSLQNNVKDPTTDDGVNFVLDKSLGSELDLVLEVKILPEINLKGGYSMLFPTKSLEKMQEIEPGQSKTAYWGWLMVTVKPALFDSKK